MDRIFISGLRVNAIIGCYPAERERRQGVTIDVELETDLAEAARSDELADTVNYAEIEERIQGSRGRLVVQAHRGAGRSGRPPRARI